MPRRLRLLWVVPSPPCRGVTAARERWWALLERLARRHEVTLLTLLEPDERLTPSTLPPGLAAVRTVARPPYVPDDPLGLLPRMVRWGSFADPRLRVAVGEAIAAGPFDVVQFEWSELAELMPSPPALPTVLTIHQLGFAFALDEWRAAGAGTAAAPTALLRHLRELDYEMRAVTRAHRVITLSTEDAARLHRFAPAIPVSVSPLGVDCTHFAPGVVPAAPPCDVLFVGHFRHLANLDSARFLVEQVRPRLGTALRMRLVGHAAPPDLLALARHADVEVVQSAPDVRPHLAAARVVVAPVRFGTGMHGKVLEALAMARPVVATALAVEGLAATPGRDFALAHDADAIAQAVRGLLDDPARGEALGRGGRALVETRFDWDPIADEHERIYEAVLRDPPPRSEPIPAPHATLARMAAGLGRWPRLALGAAIVARRGLGRYVAQRGSDAHP